jgi:hypothetical protein
VPVGGDANYFEPQAGFLQGMAVGIFLSAAVVLLLVLTIAIAPVPT